MNWILIALIPPFLWAIVNYIDKFLIERYCKDRDIGALIIFSGLIGLPFSIILCIINPHVFGVSLGSVIGLILAGAIYIVGVLFYLKALQHDGVSSVSPQSILIPIFSLILGYILLNETVTLRQFAGMTIVLSGVFLINISLKGNNLQFKSKVFLQMMLASLFMASSTIIMKVFAHDASFIQILFWMSIGYTYVSLILYTFNDKYRASFVYMLKNNKAPIIITNIISETLTVLGNIILNFAALIGTVAIVQTIVEGTQPIFVLIIGILITKYLPKFKEAEINSNFTKNFISILVMISGILLIYT